MASSNSTLIDDENAMLYAIERSKLGLFNRFLKTHPHLFSHVNVEIRLNRNIPNVKYERSLAVRLIGTREFCRQAKCVSTYPRGQVCQPSTQPLVYQSGNTTVEACQPSCFAFYDGKTDESGNYHKSPLLRYNEDASCCTMHNTPPFAQATDDYIRADHHPTARVDTIGTGFDVDTQPFRDGLDQTFKYKINKYYCDDFKLKFNGVECEPSLGQKLVSLFGSEILYKAFQYGIRQIETGVWLDDVQKVDLPNPSFSAQTTEEWLTNINSDAHFFNTDLTLNDLGITIDRKHLIFTTEYGWPGRLVEPLIFYREIIEKRNTGRPVQLRYDKYCWRDYDEFEILGYSTVIKELNERAFREKTDEPTTDPAILDALLRSVLGELASSKFYTETLPASLVNEMATVLKRVVKYSAAKFNGVVAQAVRLAEKTVMAEYIRTLGFGALRAGLLASRVLLSTLKAVTVIGIIFDIVGLIDLFFLGSDPFSSSRYEGIKFVNIYSEMDLEMNRLQWGFKTVEYSPALFISFYNFIMGDVEIKEAAGTKMLKKSFEPYAIDIEDVGDGYDNLDMFRWQSDFLFDQKYNSNGELIVWKPVIEYSDYEYAIDNSLKIPLQRYDASFFKLFKMRQTTMMVGISIVIVLVILFLITKSSNVFVLGHVSAMITFLLSMTPRF